MYMSLLMYICTYSAGVRLNRSQKAVTCKIAIYIKHPVIRGVTCPLAVQLLLS